MVDGGRSTGRLDGPLKLRRRVCVLKRHYTIHIRHTLHDMMTCELLARPGVFLNASSRFFEGDSSRLGWKISPCLLVYMWIFRDRHACSLAPSVVQKIGVIGPNPNSCRTQQSKCGDLAEGCAIHHHIMTSSPHGRSAKKRRLVPPTTPLCS